MTKNISTIPKKCLHSTITILSCPAMAELSKLNSTTIAVRIPNTLLERLERLVRWERRTRSNLCYIYIEQGVVQGEIMMQEAVQHGQG